MSSTAPVPKSELNVVMGAMTFGAEGGFGVRISNPKDVDLILDAFVSHGHTEVDSSRIYGLGTSEEMLGKIDCKSKGLKLETKLPAIHLDAAQKKMLFGNFNPPDDISHTYEDMKKYIEIALKAMNTDKLEMWYLHVPDRTIPYEVTLKAVNDLYKEGYFKRFGISNFMSWEVAEIVTICKANGYVMPSAYQGVYNAVHRVVEPELFPCLRKYGISLYGFSPLAGGFFTGRYTSIEGKVEPGSRFDPSKHHGQFSRARYWNEAYFKATASVQAVAEAHNLTMAEIALRWVSHHSLMKREHGDSVIIGGSSLKHIEQNLVDLEKGPLPEAVVTALDEAWELVKPHADKYWH